MPLLTNTSSIVISTTMIGLDNNDTKILYLLGKTPLHPSSLSVKSGIKRTTLNYRLDRLAKNQLLKRTLVGRKSVYSVVYKNSGTKTHVQTYVGREIVNAYKELLNLPRETIILAVQGSRASFGELKNLPQSFIMEAHRIFKRKKIILKALSNENNFKVFEGLGKSLVKSHMGRTMGIKLFNDNLFCGDGEIMVTKKFVLLANPKSKKAIMIKDLGITEIIYDLLSYILELTESKPSFDLNSHLKRLT